MIYPGCNNQLLTFNQLSVYAQNAGFPSSLVPTMAAIALAESSGNSCAYNPTDNNGTQTSWGLWQLSDGTHNMPLNWSSPQVNASMAYSKYKSQGLNAWGTYTSGLYKKYLNGSPVVTTSSTSNNSVVTAFNTVAQNTQDTLANIPGLIGIIETIDLAEQFQPLHLTSNASPTNPTPTDYTIFGIDTGVPNVPAAYSKLVKDIQLPADNIQAILVFVTTNTKAFAIRSGLILIGLTIIFVLIMNFLMSEVL